MTDTPIISRVENTTGILELNRPKALNSLNLEMVGIIDASLSRWRDDPAVTQVVVYTQSERGFCAGGDVRYAREAILNGTPERSDEFFENEYIMNGDIAHFSKPYISLIDGVVMGGGLGISVHGSHRVITENAYAAMPEMAIGFIPDVGVPFMLQRMVGATGNSSLALALFIVTTGWQLDPADMMWSGLATDFVAHDDIDAFRQMVIAEGIDAALDRYRGTAPGESRLAAFHDDIEATFRHNTWREVLQALESHDNPEFVELVATLTAKASPSTLVAASELLAATARCSDVREELRLEQNLGAVVRQQPDFVEGVRAVLVDKTRDPHFTPSDVADVDVTVYRRALAS